MRPQIAKTITILDSYDSTIETYLPQKGWEIFTIHAIMEIRVIGRKNVSILWPQYRQIMMINFISILPYFDLLFIQIYLHRLPLKH